MDARAPEPVSDVRGLVAYLESGCKPRGRWRVGTEHEKFVFKRGTLEPAPYEGPSGIRRFLEGLTRFGWRPVLEDGNPIALSLGACAISLEPGGQLELSGAPLATLHETCDEIHTHLAQVKVVADELGVGLLGTGFHPRARREDVPWMPKGRYRIMRAYMPTRGDLGLDMMLRSCTVQANLDFESEADMVLKFRVSLALQPAATALFANSPFVEGRPSGWLSWRSHLWERTDPDRCGVLPFVFEDGMGFERYADYALDVPMYFIRRDGGYVDVSGRSFRDFLRGRLPGREGELPTLADWEDHLTTIFPEVRLKRYLEMRGADGGPWRRLCALPALWTGLLYDPDSLAAAWDLVRGWSAGDRARLRRDAARLGLRADAAGRPLAEVARDMVEIARAGLARRAVAGAQDRDETGYLAELAGIAAGGRTPAEDMLERFEGAWGGSVAPVFEDCAY